MYWKDKRVWIKFQLLNRVWVVIKKFYPNCKRTRTKWCILDSWWVSYLLRSWNLTPTVNLWRSALLLQAVPKCQFVLMNCAVAKSCKYACTVLQVEGRSSWRWMGNQSWNSVTPSVCVIWPSWWTLPSTSQSWMSSSKDHLCEEVFSSSYKLSNTLPVTTLLLFIFVTLLCGLKSETFVPHCQLFHSHRCWSTSVVTLLLHLQ